MLGQICQSKRSKTSFETGHAHTHRSMSRRGHARSVPVCFDAGRQSLRVIKLPTTEDTTVVRVHFNTLSLPHL